MITLEQIKQLVIKSETEWREEILALNHDEDEIQHFINEMKDEINECDCVSDIVHFYLKSGIDLEDAYLEIISLLRNNSIIKE
jgi:hypothetical protein